MPSKLVEIVSQSHRQGNCMPFNDGQVNLQSAVARMRDTAEHSWDPADNKHTPGRDQVRQWLLGEDSRPMLYVFANCTHLIRTLPALQHDEHRPEEVNTHSRVHIGNRISGHLRCSILKISYTSGSCGLSWFQAPASPTGSGWLSNRGCAFRRLREYLGQRKR